MPLDYHAGRSGWLLYGRGLDKQRLTQYQSKLGAAMVIVAAWCVEDYQVIRLAGSLTAPGLRARPMKRNWMSPRWKILHRAGFAGDGHGFHRCQIECIDQICQTGRNGRDGGR